jgi:hypothetical protein
MPETVNRSLIDETNPSSTEPPTGDTNGGGLHTADLVQRADSGTTPTQETETSESVGTPLLADTDEYRRRWEAVQTGFVDEPRRAVENADALVAEVIQELATSFAQERNGLETQWSEGDQVSTEDLRVSLRRYRSFFDRLLTA